MSSREAESAQEASWSHQGSMSRAPEGGASTSGSQPATASASSLSSKELQQLWDGLRQKDAQILALSRKLNHFRSWVASVHAKVQQVNPQAIKNSKRLYVGNLPPDTTEDELKQFLHGLMIKTGALASPGTAILSCKITPEKNYAFVEFRSVEETSNAMAFDGVAFRDTFLKVRRPSNYDLATAIMLGPIQPDPTMDTSQLEICRTVVEDSPHKLFVGGLPCEWTEDTVKELLLPYGALKSFNLVMDKTTGKSKGYAFCEFQDDSTVDVIIKNLNQRRVGNKALTVKRALEGSKQHQMQPGSASGSPSNPITPAGTLAKLTAATPLTISPGQSGAAAAAAAAAAAQQHGHGNESPSALQGAFAALLQQHASGMHMLTGAPPGTPQAAAAAALSNLQRQQDLAGMTAEELAAELSQQAQQAAVQGVPTFGLQGMQGLGPGGLGFW